MGWYPDPVTARGEDAFTDVAERGPERAACEFGRIWEMGCELVARATA